MLLLLPPSEGKATPTDGPPLDLAALSFPTLTRARRSVIRDVADLCRADPDRARRVLKLGPSQDDALAYNRRLRRAATLPAAGLYTGVLYEALGYAKLSAAARRRADGSVLVFSGLWGAVRLTDRLPHYKVPISTSLGVPLVSLWRHLLAEPLAAAAGGGLVVDLRSTPYAAAWRPSGELARRTVRVAVLAERRVDGHVVRQPVSHFNKAAKGRFARALVLDPTDEPADLLARAHDAGLDGELTTRLDRPHLELVEREVTP
ncbi:MAG TPA: peroxide stress protein YaaA [Mycobacteriales bacterium]|nr:peroxide stress protein YaaA [Mycobacteriales bacterium]